MIFNVPGHIEMIRNGLFWYDGIDKLDWSLKEMQNYHTHRAQFLADNPNISKEVKAGLHPLIIKTQTRRLNRGIYQVGKSYAVQRKRGAKAELDIRIVMDRIWKERYAEYLCCYISEEDAIAEGGYTPIDYEELFRKLNPKWSGARWAFEFHVIEVQI